MDKTYEQQNREYLEQFSSDKLPEAFSNYFGVYWITDLVDYLQNNKPEILREYIIKTLSDEKPFTIAELERIRFDTK